MANSFLTNSFSQIMADAQARWKQFPAQPLTQEIIDKHARPGEDVLVLWKEQPGFENRLVVEPVIGAAIGVSRSVANRHILFVRDEVVFGDQHGLLVGYEYCPSGMVRFVPQEKWANDWRLSKIGEEFTYRKIKNRRVSVDEVRHIFRGKVFVYHVSPPD